MRITQKKLILICILTLLLNVISAQTVEFSRALELSVKDQEGNPITVEMTIGHQNEIYPVVALNGKILIHELGGKPLSILDPIQIRIDAEGYKLYEGSVRLYRDNMRNYHTIHLITFGEPEEQKSPETPQVPSYVIGRVIDEVSLQSLNDVEVFIEGAATQPVKTAGSGQFRVRLDENISNEAFTLVLQKDKYKIGYYPVQTPSWSTMNGDNYFVISEKIQLSREIDRIYGNVNQDLTGDHAAEKKKGITVELFQDKLPIAKTKTRSDGHFEFPREQLTERLNYENNRLEIRFRKWNLEDTDRHLSMKDCSRPIMVPIPVRVDKTITLVTAGLSIDNPLSNNLQVSRTTQAGISIFRAKKRRKKSDKPERENLNGQRFAWTFSILRKEFVRLDTVPTFGDKFQVYTDQKAITNLALGFNRYAFPFRKEKLNFYIGGQTGISTPIEKAKLFFFGRTNLGITYRKWLFSGGFEAGFSFQTLEWTDRTFDGLGDLRLGTEVFNEKLFHLGFKLNIEIPTP